MGFCSFQFWSRIFYSHCILCVRVRTTKKLFINHIKSAANDQLISITILVNSIFSFHSHTLFDLQPLPFILRFYSSHKTGWNWKFHKLRSDCGAQKTPRWIACANTKPKNLENKATKTSKNKIEQRRIDVKKEQSRKNRDWRIAIISAWTQIQNLKWFRITIGGKVWC